MFIYLLAIYQTGDGCLAKQTKNMHYHLRTLMKLCFDFVLGRNILYNLNMFEVHFLRFREMTWKSNRLKVLLVLFTVHLWLLVWNFLHFPFYFRSVCFYFIRNALNHFAIRYYRQTYTYVVFALTTANNTKC